MKTSNQQMNPLHDVEPEDAIGMLITDHKRVANLFADFKRLTDEGRNEEKASVVVKICQELTIHAALEEEIFYPAAREAIDDDDQMDEALVEHAGAKSLIAQLESASPQDDLYDAKVTVLREQIDHHVEEEEGSMFPKARASGIDTLKLGEVMLSRKSELLKGASPKTQLSEAAEAQAPADADDEFSAEPSSAAKKKAKSKSTKKTRR